MEDWHARNKVSHYYPHPKDKTFAGTIDQLMGHVCKECFLAFKEFEFQWEENKIMAEMHQQDEYERWKEEGCQNCDRH